VVSLTLSSVMLNATVDTNNMLGQVETLNIAPSIRLYDLHILGLQITIIKIFVIIFGGNVKIQRCIAL
jgi:hypothetical protein